MRESEILVPISSVSLLASDSHYTPYTASTLRLSLRVSPLALERIIHEGVD